MKKALVIVVILLFLGVIFQPALANEISHTVSDDEDDCLECQPMNRAEFLRAKFILIKLEIFINVILSKFSHIPEIVTICKEILEILKNGIWDIICDILLTPLSILGAFLVDILENSYFFGFLIAGALLVPLSIIFWGIFFGLNCEDWRPSIKQPSSINFAPTLAFHRR